MNEQELKKAIEAVNNNKFLPEAVKAIKIKKLNAEFEANNKGAEPKKEKAPKADTGISLTDYEEQVIDVLERDGEMDRGDAQGVMGTSENTDLIKKGHANGKSPKSIAKKILAKGQSSEKADRKPRSTSTFKGKALKDLDDAECDELRAAVKARREKQAKSEKKSKTRPVIEKVAANVAQAAKQAIKNIPAADIKDDPKGEITKMQKLETLTRKYLSDMRSILGEDYDKETIDGEMADIHKIITDLKKKYA